MIGIRHAHDCPIGKGTADPWQSDLIRTVIRVHSGRPQASVHYSCPRCHKAAIRVEPYTEKETA